MKSKQRRENQGGMPQMSRVIDIEDAQQRRRERREASLRTRRSRTSTLNVLSDETQDDVEVFDERKKIISGKRVLLFVVALTVCTFTVLSGVHIFDLKAEATAAKKEYAAKMEQKESLQSQLAMVNDSEYIEAQARERLRMIKSGEILYILKSQEKESN